MLVDLFLGGFCKHFCVQEFLQFYEIRDQFLKKIEIQKKSWELYPISDEELIINGVSDRI